MTRITEERLAELIRRLGYSVDALGDEAPNLRDELVALHELQQLRRQHREIICTRCLLREQLAKESPLPEPDPLF